ncbi:type VII secretion system-associated protein [Streptomyces sp. NPDC058417]|uniref:type VII secretion system-associated protein n=1 Tax=unclassified Streptomyces TaxID=2593676 RepID=UPI003651A3E4
MADLTHLDGTALQRFLDNDLDDFVDALKAIRKDTALVTGGEIRALESIVDGRTTTETLQQSQALAIERMASDGSVHGKSLLTSVLDAAEVVDDGLSDDPGSGKDES